MQTVEGLVAQPIDVCWRAFTNVAKLTQWVPGLRDARVIEMGDDGLPQEIMFEFVSGAVYSLVYSYDFDDSAISWEPRSGDQAVRGEVAFVETERGTRMSYSIEQPPGRSRAERSLDDPHELVAAFTRYVERT